MLISGKCKFGTLLSGHLFYSCFIQTTGQLLDLQQSVYCLDNDHRGHHPRVAIGSQNYIFIVKEEKKSS